MCLLSCFSCVQLFVTPWTTAQAVVLSRLLCPWDFSGKNTGVHCLFPSPGDRPNPRTEPVFLASPALAGRFFLKPLHQSFGWDPVFKIQQNNEYVASQPAGIRLGQGECQNISDFFTFVKAEANTRNADSLQMWVVHQRVCVCVFFSILPTGCQHFLAFWLHLQQRQSEISFTLNMKTTIDLSSMHQPVIYYTRAMYSARIKGPSAFPWQSFLFFPRFITHLLTQLFLNLAGKVSVGE